MRIGKFKSASSSLIIGPKGLQYQTQMLFIFKTMLVVLFWWIHLASVHICALSVVIFSYLRVINMDVASDSAGLTLTQVY